MSALEKDGLMACLFSSEDKKLVNIKFFRGDRDIISPDELRAQVCAIADQHAAGLVAVAPTVSKADVINVRKLVASM